jgi:hypothetical protein
MISTGLAEEIRGVTAEPQLYASGVREGKGSVVSMRAHQIFI